MQQPLVIKGTASGQVNMQPGMVTVPMTVNSNMTGSISNVMTLNKPGGQSVVVSAPNMNTGQPAILPNVQILNMRPGTPTVSAQKSVATVSPRVVIGAPQVVGSRANTPAITLQTLQSLQPGQQGHLLLKTENGQYQLLRVGPAPAASSLGAPPAQTMRLSTVPAHPGVATVSTSMAQGVMQGHLQGAMTAPVPQTSAGAYAAPPQPMQHHQQLQQPNVTTYVKPSDNTKEKCRNFLANLLDLSSKEPPSVETNVRNLIQELIDAMVEPEEFCDRLERLLNASPQPCLIGFLKKSLPLLRQSLVTKELVIEGINPPAPHIAFGTAPPAPQPVMAPMVPMPAASHQLEEVTAEPSGIQRAPMNDFVTSVESVDSLVQYVTGVNSTFAFSYDPNEPFAYGAEERLPSPDRDSFEDISSRTDTSKEEDSSSDETTSDEDDKAVGADDKELREMGREDMAGVEKMDIDTEDL